MLHLKPDITEWTQRTAAELLLYSCRLYKAKFYYTVDNWTIRHESQFHSQRTWIKEF